MSDRIQYTQQQRIEYINNWKNSGKPQNLFAKENGISVTTFHKWTHRIGVENNLPAVVNSENTVVQKRKSHESILIEKLKRENEIYKSIIVKLQIENQILLEKTEHYG